MSFKKLKTGISEILLLPNVLSLYLVEQVWFEEEKFSESRRVSTSIVFLFIIEAAVVFLIDAKVREINWRACLFFLYVLNALTTFLFFNKILQLKRVFRNSRYYFLYPFFAVSLFGSIAIIFYLYISK